MSDRGKLLVKWARDALREKLGGARASRPSGSWSDDLGATFVTLRWHDDRRLQGCIGSIEPRRNIVDDVAENAIAAGTLDPRTDPIALADVDALDVELSILSPLEPTTIEEIREGTDGVVFTWASGRRATLLPSMWDRLPTTAEFMAALEQKARFPLGRTRNDVRLFRYTVEKHVDEAKS
jgi:AmmeMemoRadiSam system protein A